MPRFNPLSHPICLAYPQWIAPSEWIEHVPFALYLVDLLRPRVFVELGTHYGVSYCAFCQAVAELQLPTRCYAVDTWEGDPHDGFYGSEVLDALTAHHQPLYGGFSRLIQQTFDQAVGYFEDGSIDLLHIDGYHTYEAVMQDFATWQPKLSERAVVLFHDINVRERDFGAWRAWEELTQRYPRHFAFVHGHGLGVLAVGEAYPQALNQLLDADEDEAALVRQLFYQLGLRLRAHQQRDRLHKELTARLTEREALLRKADADIETLNGWIRERDDLLQKSRDDITAFQGWVAERDAQIRGLQELVDNQQRDLTTLHIWVTERDQQIRKGAEDIAEFQRWIRERDELIALREREITERNGQLAAAEAQVRQQETLISELYGRVAHAEGDVATLHGWVAERDGQIRQLHGVAAAANARAARVEASLSEIQGSLGWKLLHPLWKLRQRVLPSGGAVSRNARRARTVVRVLRQGGVRGLARYGSGWVRHRVGLAPRFAPPAGASAASGPADAEPEPDAYQRWIAANEPGPAELQRQRVDAHLLPDQPLVSVLTPVYNPPAGVLAALIESVLGQTYGNWELLLVNGSPDNTELRAQLDAAAARDRRVRVLHLEGNRGIVGNTNAGLAEAQGAFVAFLDHDDTLAPFALFEVVRTLNKRPDSDLLYSDSDLLSFDGSRRFQPLFKPDWSPAIMLSANYATHLCVVRTSVLREVGGLAEGTDGAQDWDLILRVSEQTGRIVHIPKLLYHWRESPGSTATDISRKPYALQAQFGVISRHLARRGLEAEVGLTPTGYIRATWPLVKGSLVSIIIPSRNLALLQRCIESIQRHTSYRHYECIVIDTTREGTIAAHYADGAAGAVRVVRYTAPFNYSAVNNLAAEQARGDLLLFLNDDTEAIEDGWLAELVRWAELEPVGVVGGKLLREDGRIQHAGVVVGLGGFADHPFANGPEGQHTIYGCTEWYRNYSAVTGACLMIRRDLFEQVGGFDEELALCGNDVELCLRVGRMGYQVMYTPFARLRHLESVTRGTAIPRDDFLHSYLHYRPLLVAGDPFYNPNLSGWSNLPQLRQQDEEAPLAFAERYLAHLGLEIPADGERAVEQGTVSR